MFRRARTLALLPMCVLIVGCGGGGNSATAPTPSIPNVTGSDSGTATFTFPELGVTMSCPASTTVTQSGNVVTLAPLILTGQCAGESIPLSQTTIDNTGAIEGGRASGTYTDPTCGTYCFVASGGFFGRELRLSVSATSTTCYNFNFTATLTR